MIIIEFGGTPKAGKTTLIDAVDRFLRRQGLKVLAPPEAANFIRNGREHPLYSFRTTLCVVETILEQVAKNDYDVIVFDRGLYDRYCWFVYERMVGKLEESSFLFFQEFCLRDEWRLDLGIFLICSPEEAVSRDRKSSLSEEDGFSADLNLLKSIYDGYKIGYNELVYKGKPVYRIDTTALMLTEVRKLILERITSLL
jgi:thymidylate kinase